MKPIDLIIVLVSAIVVTFVIIKSIKDKKKGKTSCGCDCANCKGCGSKFPNDKNFK